MIGPTLAFQIDPRPPLAKELHKQNQDYIRFRFPQQILSSHTSIFFTFGNKIDFNPSPIPALREQTPKRIPTMKG